MNTQKHYKNGVIDRKAACESQISSRFEILKSRMVGSVFYAALKPKERDEVFAAVILTRVNGREIGTKIMDETAGPFYCDCPESVLSLLTPTKDKEANEWRKECRLRIEQNKKKQVLDKLPAGSVIQFVQSGGRTGDGEPGKKIMLQKMYSTGCWTDGVYLWKKPSIPADYEVVSTPGKEKETERLI